MRSESAKEIIALPFVKSIDTFEKFDIKSSSNFEVHQIQGNSQINFSTGFNIFPQSLKKNF